MTWTLVGQIIVLAIVAGVVVGHVVEKYRTPMQVRTSVHLDGKMIAEHVSRSE